MFPASRIYSRPSRVAFVLLGPAACIGFVFGVLFQGDWLASTTRCSTGLSRNNVPLAAVVEEVHAYLEARSLELDLQQTKDELGLSLGTTSRAEYEQDLRDKWTDFFGSAEDPRLGKILDHLSILPCPDSPPLPRVVYTTDLRSRSQAPIQYDSWAQVNPDWDERYMMDEEIDVWLQNQLGRGYVVQQMETLRGRRGILRSDMFRYLVLLLEGGVYTDSDTASVRPIADWFSSPDFRVEHPLMAALPHLVQLVSPTAIEYDDTPSLVVSIEADCLGKDQRDYIGNGLVRCIQIVQWTILARPFHPVFLDALGDGLRRYRAHVQNEAEAGLGSGDPAEVLNQFGPGPFSDAVFRYLLVRYGVHPRELSGIDRPVRYGDIVVLPNRAFHADASEPEVQQGEHMVVWHGFLGRWRQHE